MPLGTGEMFAGFTVVRLLGSGGMGEVYLVNHPRLPRLEALKILPGEISADPEFRERFNREADLAASLSHPHVVAIHDQGEHDGQLWISMDYVDGADAAQLIRQHYRTGFPHDQAIEIVGAVAGALDYAHERGLLHRDVKPANILIGSGGSGDRRITLADFGIARRISDISGLTATNMVVGTVAYAAPEQLTGSEIDGRADQYALAATAYQLLCGETLFNHPNPAVVIGRHLSAAPPQLGAARPDLAHLDVVMSRALAKEPSARFASCRDFAAALRGDTRAARPTCPTPRAQSFTPTRKESSLGQVRENSARRRRVLRPISIGAVVLAVIALVSILLLTRRGPADSPRVTAQDDRVRATIQSYDSAVKTGDLTILRNITCGATHDGYMQYDEHSWQATYQRVLAAKQYPVIGSIDHIAVDGQHAKADVTTFMAYDPQVRSTRSLDLQYRDKQWKICQSPSG
ncbi:hypothetical protein MMAN_35100 [Mycobacterium mantenii]|uniref:non-specific serine/threonine protein kinase n=1 Tax=Mycobacterium mantenii TaxID=560555 RepID=A0A1X0FF30_MYCNT|nr:serine/threonine-protein kinase [Mycobacterium mantenii]MCV7242581.1 serine/threonine protein kinase [Mycobacterium mantenii]ORB00422.1 hypothetical protein BST30_22735 [Mycobacterium mantenii]BBY39376.1 hypothetical protein MMAN_35100 [Mycobacterium mantenii]